MRKRAYGKGYGQLKCQDLLCCFGSIAMTDYQLTSTWRRWLKELEEFAKDAIITLLNMEHIAKHLKNYGDAMGLNETSIRYHRILVTHLHGWTGENAGDFLWN